MPKEPTTITTWAVALSQTLQEKGIDPADLFRRAGLDPALLGNPDARYPFPNMQKLWALAVEASGDRAIGLEVGRRSRPTHLHALGFAMLASPTLREALRRASRYLRIVSDALWLEVEESDEGVISLRGGTNPSGAPEAVDAALASGLQMARALVGAHDIAGRVRMRRAEPPQRARYDDFFGVAVEFGAQEDSVLYPRSIADQPLLGANPELAARTDEVAAKYLAGLDSASVADRLRAALIAELPSGEPDARRLAARLHLSTRTLQRRLSAEGTSFKRLLDEVRHDLALSYVRQTAIPLAQIGFQLGFSDQSNFTRAFRRWTGTSPGEYRHTLAAAIED